MVDRPANLTQETTLNKIKTIREAAGLTQAAASERAGIAQTHWCAAEKRSQESLRNLPYASLERFARALGCEVADVLGEATP